MPQHSRLPKLMCPSDSDLRAPTPGRQRELARIVEGVNVAESLRLLQQAGMDIAASDHNALQRIVDGLCALSSSDGLTGLANRRVFDHALLREIGRSMRSAETFGILLIDIDH